MEKPFAQDLVVTSAAENGGTWSGATEAIECARIPVYVRDADTNAEGNRKLLARGAKPFPPQPWDDLRSLLTPLSPEITLLTPEREASVPVSAQEQPAKTQHTVTPPGEPCLKPAEPSSRDLYPVILPVLLAILAEPRSERNVEEVFGLVAAQAKAWLKRACDEGRIRKLSRPLRYVVNEQSALVFTGGPGDSPADAHS